MISWPGRRDLAVVVAHVAARVLVVAAYTGLPDRVRGLAYGDLALYSRWAGGISTTGAAPDERTWMYPPGSVPVLLAPLPLPWSYSVAFVVILAVLDAAVLALLLTRARDGGHRAGAWAWALLPPLLGLITWSRLDLVPVAATAASLVWAERRGTRWAVASGAAAAIGAAVKGWPVLLGVLLFRRREWTAAALGTGLALAALATVAVDGVWDFTGRLAGRGLQVESVLATPWLVVQVLGTYPDGDFVNGTYEFLGPGTVAVTTVAPVLVVAALAASAWATRRCAPAVRWWAMSTALLATSSLLSTQFILWLVGAAAVAAALPGPEGAHVRRCLPVVAVIVWLSHAGFPIQWDGLLGGDRWAAATVAIRNVLLVGLAVVTSVRLSRLSRMPAGVTALPAGAAPGPARNGGPAGPGGAPPTPPTTAPGQPTPGLRRP